MPRLANLQNINKTIEKSINNKPKPKEIVDPLTLQVTTLDDISVKLSKLIDITTINQKYLNAILKEQRIEADEGQELTQNGTALSTEFTFIDIGQLKQGLKVKGFELANDGVDNAIYFAWNQTQGGLQPSLDDPTSSLTKFRLLQPGDSIKIIFNRKIIRNVSIIGQGGSSTYRLWMVW
jgi:hypothetical protein